VRLPDKWVNKIVLELQGIYGQQFTGKYSKIEGGTDVGIANFKESMANRLGGFCENPEAIGYALKNLPTTHCPNVLEFQAIANLAPKKDVPAIEYKPTAEDIERNRRMAEKATKAVTNHVDPMHCWRRPKSQIVADYLFDAHKNPSRFRPLSEIFDKHVANEVISPEGKLLHKWNGLGWQKA